jgi:hypothetical protein
VSADLLTGPRLPYVDGLVNALIVDDAQRVPVAEFVRVLVPGGVLLTRDKAVGTPPGLESRPCDLPGCSSFAKPWPAGLDDWPSALYDASNNAVNQDTVVGPPRHIQWVSGPAWTRSHDHLASVSVAVSSGGRLFAIVDEGSIASVLLPAQWFLVARDAFNGVELWRQPISP